MSFLRNPIVVICLALVALLLLGRSLSPIWRRGRPAAPTPAPASAPAQAAAPAPAPIASNTPAQSAAKPEAEAVSPERSIDLSRVGWSLNGAPRRDPFQIIHPGALDLARLYPPVSELMVLSAIWRQTDSSLAIINQRIVGEGDTVLAKVESRTSGGAPGVLEFTVESIRANSVWLQGPAGREELEFKSIIPGPNNTAPTAVR
jgi:hypothetical protein